MKEKVEKTRQHNSGNGIGVFLCATAAPPCTDRSILV